MQRSVVKVIVIVVALAVAVSPAVGARKPRADARESPALTGVVANGSYTASGSGFEPGAMIVLNIGEADACCSAVNVFADASGAFSYTRDVSAPGSYFVRAAELSNDRWRFVAEWYFDVY